MLWYDENSLDVSLKERFLHFILFFLFKVIVLFLYRMRVIIHTGQDIFLHIYDGNLREDYIDYI